MAVEEGEMMLWRHAQHSPVTSLFPMVTSVAASQNSKALGMGGRQAAGNQSCHLAFKNRIKLDLASFQVCLCFDLSVKSNYS